MVHQETRETLENRGGEGPFGYEKSAESPTTLKISSTSRYGLCHCLKASIQIGVPTQVEFLLLMLLLFLLLLF